MAKRQGKIAATEHRIEDFAEDLGKMLGQARNKAEGWLGQRDAIVKNLTQLRDTPTPPPSSTMLWPAASP
jgi:hypothetical protein